MHDIIEAAQPAMTEQGEGGEFVLAGETNLMDFAELSDVAGPNDSDATVASVAPALISAPQAVLVAAPVLGTGAATPKQATAPAVAGLAVLSVGATSAAL